jgi:hypothetical protein
VLVNKPLAPPMARVNHVHTHYANLPPALLNILYGTQANRIPDFDDSDWTSDSDDSLYWVSRRADFDA